MPWLELALWGIAGGVAIDGVEFHALMRKTGGRYPAYLRSTGYWVGETIRLLSGGALAVAFGQAGQIAGPLGALMVGISTPLLVKRIAEGIPRLGGPTPRQRLHETQEMSPVGEEVQQ